MSISPSPRPVQTRIIWRSLRIDNFVYFRKRENNGTIIWYCSNKSCKARAQCDDRLENRNIIHGAHSHPPKSDEFFLSASITHGVKRRISVDASERPQKAVDVTIKTIPTEALCGTDLKRFTYVAKRKKYAKKPPQPKSDQELTDAWIKLMIGDRKVEGGELVLDIIDNIVMLGSSMSLILLQEHNHQLFCDGTFRFAPRGYYQLYSIHVLIGTCCTFPLNG